MEYQSTYDRFMSCSLDQRREENQRIREKYPDRIPVVVKTSQFKLENYKFLVPPDLTVGQLVYVIRNRIGCTPDVSLFVMFDDIIPTTSTVIETLDNEGQGNKEDGFFTLFCPFRLNNGKS